jgi:hypothetical protein
VIEFHEAAGKIHNQELTLPRKPSA